MTRWATARWASRRGWLAALGLALVVLGQWLIAEDSRGGRAVPSNGRASMSIAMWAVGAMVVALIASSGSEPTDVGTRARPLVARVAWPAAAVATVEWFIVIALDRRSPGGLSTVAMTLAWLLSITFAFVAVGRSPIACHTRSGLRRRIDLRRSIGTCWPEVVVVGAAFLMRIVRLGSVPFVIDSDGAAFTLLAQRVGNDVVDPFTTGYLDHPTLFAFLQRASMEVVRDHGLVGSRALSAVAGTAAVAATYALVRRVGSRRQALMAAAVLAVLPAHVLFSRIALNNVFDSLSLPLTLLLVDRAVRDRSLGAALAAGVTAGIAQYLYLGSRLVVPVAIGYGLAVHLIDRRRALSAATDDDAPGGAAHGATRLLIAAAAGLVLAVTPLALHYIDQPEDFNARYDAVRFFGAHLSSLQRESGRSAASLTADQIGASLMMPFRATPRSGVHVDAPMVGWWLAIPAAIGIAVALLRPRRRIHLVLLATWFPPLLALALTTGSVVQRWVIGMPGLAIAAAIGIDAIVRAFDVDSSGRRIGIDRLACSALIAGASVTGVVGFDRLTHGIDRYSDANSLVATVLGHQLADDPDPPYVVTLFRPRMGFRTHFTVELLAPEASGIDIDAVLTSPAELPVLTGRVLFVALPERVGELEVVAARYPGGEYVDVATWDLPLYTTYLVDIPSTANSSAPAP